MLRQLLSRQRALGGLGLPRRVCTSALDTRLNKTNSLGRLAKQKFSMSSVEVLCKPEADPHDAGASSSGSPTRRRVQFADEVGKELIQVRLLGESSHDPPELPMSILQSSFHQVQLADTAEFLTSLDELQADGLAQRVSDHEFKCQFEQPMAKYILYRQVLDKQCVCLSSLCFDTCQTVTGSVGVKNVCYNKRVFARVTFDSWTTFRDVEAVYYSSSSSEGCGGHDNFAFNFVCPSQTAFEFCVAFEALDLGQTFWDNSAGANYKVAVQQKRKPRFDHVTDAGQSAAWNERRAHGGAYY